MFPGITLGFEGMGIGMAGTLFMEAVGVLSGRGRTALLPWRP